MSWKTLLAYITGTVDHELLLRNEYLVTENRILRGATLQTKIEHLNTVLEEHTDELERGEFLVVTPGRIRVAGRPRA